MEKVRITKEFRFEAAHSLPSYDGKCSHIHGHSYILYVTVTGCPIDDDNSPKNGMLMDFAELKHIVAGRIIDKFDHALMLSGNSPLAKEIGNAYGNVIRLSFRPTCENLVIHFAGTIKDCLPEGVSLFSLRLHETAGSYAEWFASDN